MSTTTETSSWILLASQVCTDMTDIVDESKKELFGETAKRCNDLYFGKPFMLFEPTVETYQPYDRVLLINAKKWILELIQPATGFTALFRACATCE